MPVTFCHSMVLPPTMAWRADTIPHTNAIFLPVVSELLTLSLYLVPLVLALRIAIDRIDTDGVKKRSAPDDIPAQEAAEMSGSNWIEHAAGL